MRAEIKRRLDRLAEVLAEGGEGAAGYLEMSDEEPEDATAAAGATAKEPVGA